MPLCLFPKWNRPTTEKLVSETLEDPGRLDDGAMTCVLWAPRARHFQKQDYFPWEKVPEVPRPSLVQEPFTVWGRKQQDPRKEFYQYVTLPEKAGVVRGKDAAKQDHTRQLVDSGAVSRVGLDAAAELATRGHVFEKGVLARPSSKVRHATTPATGRTRILMALQTPSWYRF